MRYFRPKSLTWWAGMFLIATGALQAALPELGGGDGQNWIVDVLTALTAALAPIMGTGGAEATPAALMGMGIGLIGLRDAIQRERDEAFVMAEDRHAHAVAMVNELAVGLGAQKPVDLYFEDDEGDLPEGVRDPWAEGGSRS